jgi:pseudouridine kinase
MTERELEILKIIKQNPMISQNELAYALCITRSGAAAHIHNLIKKGYIKGKGYVLSEPRFVTVVGGINIDIMGVSKSRLIRDNSNPGKIYNLLGGAGRNISLTLTKLDVPNYFISVFGDDINGDKFVEDSNEHNMDIQYCERITGIATSSFLYIDDSDGSRIMGIDDMDIYQQMTPAFIEKNLERINHSEYCIIDTNLPKETIDYICKKVTVPLIVKTVSMNKNHRFIHNLDKIKFLITSQNELAQMVSELKKPYANLETAADTLLNQGLENIIVFSMRKGLFYKSANTKYIFNTGQHIIVNPVGAGSTLTGALVWGLQKNIKLEDTLKYAYTAACMTMEEKESVNPYLSNDALFEKKQQYFQQGITF